MAKPDIEKWTHIGLLPKYRLGIWLGYATTLGWKTHMKKMVAS